MTFGSDVEVLVIDGGTEGIADWLTSAAVFPWAQLESEADRGIYDGMNKGLARSSGRFVWFLNGGDESSAGDGVHLKVLLEMNEGSMVFAGFQMRAAHHLISRKARSAAYIRHGLPTSHQAIFYPGDAARRTRYDLGFKVTGDYDFTARILAEGVSSVVSPLQVAVFELGGMSEVHSRDIAREADRVQRDVLGASGISRARSQARHRVSRILRRLLSTYAGLRAGKS